MPRRRRLLLLNPPGSREWTRDFYMGSEGEAAVRLPPQDLVSLSGPLSAAGELAVVDALAEGLGPDAALKKAAAFAPDDVVFLSAVCSYTEDSKFLSELKTRLPKARFIGTGDLYRETRELAFSLQPFLDAVLLDFSTEDALAYVQGPGGGAIDNVIYRGEAPAPVRGRVRRLNGPWEPAAPRWELFPLQHYRWPFSAQGPAASLLTEYGCPFLCTYCPASSLGHKWRSLDSVLAEARGLKELGVKSVFIRDQSFASHRGRALELLSRLAKAKLGFTLAATTRVDLVDAELLTAMRKAGFAAVCYGIDSGRDELLRDYKKSTTRKQALRAVQLAREAGLKAWGAFMLGLSMDTPDSVEQTLAFSRELGLDHVSYRVDPSRYAAAYKKDMLVKGLVPPESMPPDTPTSTSVWQGKLGIFNDAVFELHAKALAKERAAAA